MLGIPPMRTWMCPFIHIRQVNKVRGMLNTSVVCFSLKVALILWDHHLNLSLHNCFCQLHLTSTSLWYFIGKRTVRRTQGKQFPLICRYLIGKLSEISGTYFVRLHRQIYSTSLLWSNMSESEENQLKIFIEKGTDPSPVDNMKINHQCESVVCLSIWNTAIQLQLIFQLIEGKLAVVTVLQKC